VFVRPDIDTWFVIFDENQNPVDMHTSIISINIMQNIKAVTPKL
jgi:ABC-type enterochelin transport system ATPase subunit